MIRYVAIVLAVCCLALAVGIVALINRSEVVEEQPISRDTSHEQFDERTAPASGNDWDFELVQKVSGVVDFPLEETNWHCENCRVTASALEFAEGKSGRAVFLIPFRQIALNFRVAATSEDAAFEIRLFSQTSSAAVTIRFDETGVTVFDGDSARNQVLAHRDLKLGLDAGQSKLCRVAATGNRIIIAWDEKRVLTCEQPAEQSGTRVLFSFNCEDAALELSDFRIDGE